MLRRKAGSPRAARSLIRTPIRLRAALVAAAALLALVAVPAAQSARKTRPPATTPTTTCPTSSSSYKSAVTGTPGLVSYWRLDESSGTTACDTKGLNKGTYQSGDTLGQGGALSGDANKAVALNGSTGSVDVPSSASLNPSGQLSIEAWARPNATNVSQTVARKDQQYLLRLSGQTVTFRIWSGGTLTELTTGNVLTAGVYQHLVATYDGSQMSVYLNGKQVASRALSGAIGQSSNRLYLGQSGSYDYFGGRLDEVAIYNQAMTAAAVQNHYTLGTGSTSAPPSGDTTAPSAPSGLSASAGDSRVTLSWSAASDNVGVSGYDVYRNGVKVGSAADTGYVDSGLTNGTTYSYYVMAYDAAGNKSAASSTVSGTPRVASGTGTNGCSSGNVSWSNGWGSFAGLSWPDGCWRPYGDSAPFNTPLPANARLAANSSAVVSTVQSWNQFDDPAVGMADTSDDWSKPIYYSRSSDPLYTIHCNKYSCPSIEGTQVRIPSNARPAGGGDGHMIVEDQTSGYEYEFWQVQTKPLPAGGGAITISTGGRTRNGVTGADGLNADGNAAQWGLAAGLVRAPELDTGFINHGVFMVTKCDNNSYVYPAHGLGRACSSIGVSNTNAPPMGSVFRLDPSYATDAWLQKFPPWKQAMLRAIRDYGLYFGDTGGGWVGAAFESGSSYTSYGVQDKLVTYGSQHIADPGSAITSWSSNGRTNYVFQLVKDVDWSHLQLVDPCVIQRTC
jgi:Concanavalin A-like lectin/glucanases superfamily